MGKKGAGRPSYEPTPETRAQVEALSGYGVTQEQISIYLDIDPKTLRKYYRKELDGGTIKANAAVARKLYNAAVNDGNVTAMIFWLKTRAQWREKSEVAITGPDGEALPPTTIELVGVKGKD